MAKKKKTVNKSTTSKVIINAMQQRRKAAVDMLTANANLLRSDMLNKLLNPGKDINLECGYPDTISTDDYKLMYKRLGVAKRIVKILPEETWSMPPTVYEGEEAEDSEFDKIWKDLQKDSNVSHYLQRVDSLSGIGQYGILLLGINDGQPLNEPVVGIDLSTGESTGKNDYELLYLKAFDQAVIEIKEKEANITSPRYGLPTLYSIEMEGVGTASSSTKQIIHWTRAIHIADGRESSEVLGTPRMEPVYNNLLDLRKIFGGSGEMFWKGGFPGLSFETQPEPGDIALDTDKLKDQVESYMNGMQRYLATEGIQVKSLLPQVVSPKEHIEMNMRAIAVSLGIPYRIFLGTEEAKLASTQDIETWNKRVSQRQENYASPYIVRPFVNRMIAFGVLPEIKDGYIIDWPDLNAPTDQDKAEVAKSTTEALSKYVQGGVDALIPPMEFLTIILKLTIEEAEAIEKAANGFLGLEEEPEEPEEKVVVKKEKNK